jgi:hypothetical protein
MLQGVSRTFLIKEIKLLWASPCCLGVLEYCCGLSAQVLVSEKTSRYTHQAFYSPNSLLLLI